MAPFYTPRLILKVLFTRFIVTNLRRIMMALFFGLKWLAIIFCFILFVLLMLDSYKKFTNKMTNVGVRTEPMDKSKKIPPCITVCAFEAFRTTGFFYREADFIRETFKKEDIILDETNMILSECPFSTTQYFQSKKYEVCFWVDVTQFVKR